MSKQTIIGGLVFLALIFAFITANNYINAYKQSLELEARKKWVDCHIQYDKMGKDPGMYCSNLSEVIK